MDHAVSHWLYNGFYIAGAALILVGWMLRRWASKYDLKEAAFDSAWTTVRGKRSAENPTALEEKLRDINAASTVTGKATRAAGTVAGHFAAQVAGLGGLLSLLAGMAMIAAGYYWG
jgi:hypothetical protein